MKTKNIIIAIIVIVIIAGGLFLIFGGNLRQNSIEKEINKLLKNETLTEEQIANLNKALKSLKANPEDASALLAIAMIEYELEDYDGAKEIYYQALEIQPDNIIIYHNLGNIYTIEENWEKAEEIYLTIIEKTPKWISAYNDLESIYRFHIKEKYPEMEQILLTAIERTTDISEYAPVDLYIMLGGFYKRTGDNSNAIKYYEIALKIMPDNKDIKRELETLKQ